MLNKQSYVGILFVIVASALVVSGSAFKGINFWKDKQSKIKNSKEYLVKSIYQTGPKKEAISTTLLAEILELSLDKPKHLYDLEEKSLENKLMSFPIFQSVSIQKKRPSAIYVEYALREPFAKVKDYNDIVIDEDGVFFPYQQFFSQKNIPEVYIGVEDQLDLDERKKLAIDLVKMATEKLSAVGFKLSLVDVSNAFCDSYAKREVILQIISESSGIKFPYFLRLNSSQIDKQLSNFLVLTKELSKQEKLFSKLSLNQKPKHKVIDLRMEGMALID